MPDGNAAAPEACCFSRGDERVGGGGDLCRGRIRSMKTSSSEEDGSSVLGGGLPRVKTILVPNLRPGDGSPDLTGGLPRLATRL